MKTISKILALSLLLSFFVIEPSAQAKDAKNELSEVIYESPQRWTPVSSGTPTSYVPIFKDSQGGLNHAGQTVTFSENQKLDSVSFYVHSTSLPLEFFPLTMPVLINVGTRNLKGGLLGVSIFASFEYEYTFEYPSSGGYWAEFNLNGLEVPEGQISFMMGIDSPIVNDNLAGNAYIISIICGLSNLIILACPGFSDANNSINLTQSAKSLKQDFSSSWSHFNRDAGSNSLEFPGEGLNAYSLATGPGKFKTIFRRGEADIKMRINALTSAQPGEPVEPEAPEPTNPVPLPPDSWATFVPPDEPSEVKLRTVGFSADQPGWSLAAATQTVIRYHQNRVIDQCELVKLGRVSSNCESGPGQANEVVESFYRSEITGVARDPEGIVSLDKIKEEIRDGRPLIAKLDNFTINSQEQPETYAIINGFSENGVHFGLFPHLTNGTAVFTNQGETIPYEDFVNMSAYTYEYNNETISASWNWAGVTLGMTGQPLPSEDDSEENYRPEDISKMIWNDTPSLFILTLTAMDKLGVGMQCVNPNPEALEGNAEMLETLRAFWKLNALTNMVQYMPLPTTGIARSMPVEDALDALLPVWIAGFQGGIAESFTPGMGFETYVAGNLFSLAYLEGACN